MHSTKIVKTMDSQKKIHKYFYILGYNREGVYLDSFYELQRKVNTVEESLLMQAIGDDTEQYAIYRDSQALGGMNLRSQYVGDKLRVMTCEVSMDRDQFEEFLKIEHKHNPNSKWLK